MYGGMSMCCVFTNLVVALVERLLAVPELLCQSAYFRPQLDVDTKPELQKLYFLFEFLKNSISFPNEAGSGFEARAPEVLLFH